MSLELPKGERFLRDRLQTRRQRCGTKYERRCRSHLASRRSSRGQRRWHQNRFRGATPWA